MKVLIIGFGSIAKKHLTAIKSIDSNSVVYALRRNLSKAISEENVINVDSYQNLDFDFILISNPTFAHGDSIKSVLGLNKPLFIEKPLFDSLRYENLVEEVTKLKIPSYIACNLRFLDSIKFVKDFITTKRINEINIYSGSYLPDWRPNVDFRKIYSANKEMGGGVHIDLIHEIDYLIYILGFPKTVKKYFKSNSSLEISSIDYANYLLTYDNFSANVILNYYRKNAKRSLEIVCEDGECYVDLFKNTVFWNGEEIFNSDQRLPDTYKAQMEYFVESVLSNKEINNLNNINEAYNILRICLED